MRLRIALSLEVALPEDRTIPRAGVHDHVSQLGRRAVADFGLEAEAVRCQLRELAESSPLLCASCGEPIPRDRHPGGRPRRFCSDRCRIAAARRRRQGLAESLPRVSPGGRRRLRDGHDPPVR